MSANVILLVLEDCLYLNHLCISHFVLHMGLLSKFLQSKYSNVRSYGLFYSYDVHAIGAVLLGKTDN